MPAINCMEKVETVCTFHTLRSTPFGPVALLWTNHRRQPKVCGILLSKPRMLAQQSLKKVFPGSKASSCDLINDLGGRIEAFLLGDDVYFSLDIAQIDVCTQFQRNVLLAEYRIPRGSVSTYQRIASHLGKPTGARAVGTALAKNPFPIIIPCHRAIRSDGMLGGYQGGLKMKQALLEQEGIRFDEGGRVVTEKMFY